MVRLNHEKRSLMVPSEALKDATDLLIELGLSLRVWPDGSVTAIIRHGFQGALDRLAILHAELRFTTNHRERRQWLEMCWNLPRCQHILD